MKAIEFQSQLNTDRTLAVPAGLADDIPVGKKLRVLVLLGESTHEQEWEELGATEFGQGYADTDAIYDQFSNG